jgi:hypothetical protein
MDVKRLKTSIFFRSAAGFDAKFQEIFHLQWPLSQVDFTLSRCEGNLRKEISGGLT